MNMRLWRYEDLNEIAELESECFSQDPWNVRMLAECFLSPHFVGVLMEEDGAVTAYGGIGVAEDEAEVQLIATGEMYRRCGRGKLILARLEEEAKSRGAKRMFLEVRVSNSAALLMYLKDGFEGIYTRPRYYRNGEDAVVMKKELV